MKEALSSRAGKRRLSLIVVNKYWLCVNAFLRLLLHAVTMESIFGVLSKKLWVLLLVIVARGTAFFLPLPFRTTSEKRDKRSLNVLTHVSL